MNSEQVEVRVARAQDFDEVLALWEVARSSAALTPDTKEGLGRLIEADPNALFVAEREGQIAGVVISAWDGWRGSVYRLAVAPELRRLGIGTALAGAAQQRLIELGAPKVTLMLGNADQAAARFWVSCGYHHDDEVQRFVKQLT